MALSVRTRKQLPSLRRPGPLIGVPRLTALPPASAASEPAAGTGLYVSYLPCLSSILAALRAACPASIHESEHTADHPAMLEPY